jgi:hypothetical protein
MNHDLIGLFIGRESGNLLIDARIKNHVHIARIKKHNVHSSLSSPSPFIFSRGP